MPVLTISNLTKKYGKLTALDNLNLTIEKGNVYGLLGPNGSGKTTTLGIILGILAQNSGDYQWFDGQYGDHARMRIGAILETPNFYPYLDAASNLNIVSVIKNVPPSDYDEHLKLVDLYQRRHSKFRTYSLGMKQRLAIAATLIGDPDVVIFDEPTNGLDPQGIAEVRNILKRVADSGKTVIMASHILDEVEKICSHVAIIKNGKLLETGLVGSLLSSDTVLELASHDMEKLAHYLNSNPDVNRVEELPNFYECTINDGTSRHVISSMIDQGIIPSHLVERKRRLEEEFLEITKNA